MCVYVYVCVCVCICVYECINIFYNTSKCILMIFFYWLLTFLIDDYIQVFMM